MNRRAPASRRGTSILVSAVCLLSVLSLLQLVQGLFMSSVGERGERAGERRRATLLGESAIAEALAEVRVDLNQPDTRLGAFLAAERLATGATVTERFTTARLPETASLGRSEAYRSLSLIECAVRVTACSAPVAADSINISGIIEIDATVRSRETRVVQRVARTLAFKRVAPCLPGSLHGLTALFRRPAYLLRHSAFINTSMKTLADTEIPDETARLDEITTGLAELARSIESAGAEESADPEAQELSAWVQALRSLYDDLRRDLDLAAMRQALGQWKALPEDADRVIAISRAPDVELTDLDLSGRFEMHWQRVVQASDALDRAGRAADDSLDRGEFKAAPHEEAVRAYRAWAATIQGLVDEMARARSALELVSADQPGHAPLANAYAAIDPRQLEADASPLERRATARLAGPQGDLERFLARISRAGGETRGIAVVEPEGPLARLPGRRPGRWLVAVRGGVEIPAGEGSAGEPWVVLAGRRDRPVRLAGDVQVTLVMSGERLDAPRGTSLRGRLIAQDLPADARGAVPSVRLRRPADEAPVMQVTVAPWVRSALAESPRR